MSIIISPFSKVLKNGKENPKNFPYWDELIARIKDHHNFKTALTCDIVQVGVLGEKAFNNARQFRGTFAATLNEILVNRNYGHLIISVDNTIPHFVHYYRRNLCVESVVIFSQSDPEIFGYKQNINILKDRKYLRPNQFATWEEAEYNQDAFPSAEEVFNRIKHLL